MPYHFFYWDSMYSYLVLIVPVLILSIWAQYRVKSTYRKFGRVRNGRGLTGAMAARMILDQNGLQHVAIQHVSGDLTDHFDPRSNVVRLSDSTYNSTSVAAVGVAAHEVGHAVQYARGYVPMKIRGAIIPAANIGSSLSIPLLLLGLVFSMPAIVWLGVGLFALVAVFQLVTLPVELNASRRALDTLESFSYLSSDEMAGAKKVLTAAAMTYVAALLMSLAQLLRLVMLARRND